MQIYKNVKPYAVLDDNCGSNPEGKRFTDYAEYEAHCDAEGYCAHDILIGRSREGFDVYAMPDFYTEWLAFGSDEAALAHFNNLCS